MAQVLSRKWENLVSGLPAWGAGIGRKSPLGHLALKASGSWSQGWEKQRLQSQRAHQRYHVCQDPWQSSDSSGAWAFPTCCLEGRLRRQGMAVALSWGIKAGGEHTQSTQLKADILLGTSAPRPGPLNSLQAPVLGFLRPNNQQVVTQPHHQQTSCWKTFWALSLL